MPHQFPDELSQSPLRAEVRLSVLPPRPTRLRLFADCLTRNSIMKSITSWPRIAAVSLLFGALVAGIMALTSTRSAIGSPDNSIIPAPLGVIETDGTLDTTFNAGTITNGLVLASTYQSDGKLLIAGQFTQVHGVIRARHRAPEY